MTIEEIKNCSNILIDIKQKLANCNEDTKDLYQKQYDCSKDIMQESKNILNQICSLFREYLSNGYYNWYEAAKEFGIILNSDDEEDKISIGSKILSIKKITDTDVIVNVEDIGYMHYATGTISIPIKYYISDSNLLDDNKNAYGEMIINKYKDKRHRQILAEQEARKQKRIAEIEEKIVELQTELAKLKGEI